MRETARELPWIDIVCGRCRRGTRPAGFAQIAFAAA
jgi:hypothetical protein